MAESDLGRSHESGRHDSTKLAPLSGLDSLHADWGILVPGDLNNRWHDQSLVTPVEGIVARTLVKVPNGVFLKPSGGPALRRLDSSGNEDWLVTVWDDIPVEPSRFEQALLVCRTQSANLQLRAILEPTRSYPAGSFLWYTVDFRLLTVAITPGRTEHNLEAFAKNGGPHPRKYRWISYISVKGTSGFTTVELWARQLTAHKSSGEHLS